MTLALQGSTKKKQLADISTQGTENGTATFLRDYPVQLTRIGQAGWISVEALHKNSSDFGNILPILCEGWKSTINK